MKVIVRLLVLLPYLMATGCRDCYPSEEPKLKAIFQQNGVDINPTFQRVYGLHGKGDIIKGKDFYYLPVSLLADSVTYIFENPGHTDTLTIFYSRNYAFHSERCGYEAQFYENEAVTTFANASVTFLSDRKYVYEVSIEQ